MKIKEIKELSVEELQARKRELNKEAFHLRLQKQTGQLEKPSQIRSIRREIARVETILTQRSAQTA
ncbi:MAG: 50S ribosomal protein L29 [Chthoniobacteraceae bacterium]|nr:50S ribosomal protein L29 [Chthoniobacteraceae bacterium]